MNIEQRFERYLEIKNEAQHQKTKHEIRVEEHVKVIKNLIAKIPPDVFSIDETRLKDKEYTIPLLRDLVKVLEELEHKSSQELTIAEASYDKIIRASE